MSARRLSPLLTSIALLLVSGCQHAASTTQVLQGGTPGELLLMGATPADVQVNVFASDRPDERLAYGVTDHDGLFQLIAADGQTPWTLEPGEYRITLESVAADPIPIPTACQQTSTTPLIQTWPTPEDELRLEVR